MTAMITEEIFSSLIEPHEVSYAEKISELKALNMLDFDIVLSDLQIPETTPEALLDWLSQNLGHAKRFVFTSIQDEHLISKVRASGAIYLSKSTRFKDIVNEVQACLRRDVIRTDVNEHRGIYQSLIQVPGSPKPLTIKQAKVIEKLSSGLSVKEIARELSVSPDTVKAHLRDAFLRLDASNGKEAVTRYLDARRMAERLYGKEAVMKSMCD